MQELIDTLNALFVSAVMLTILGSFVTTWLVLKVLDVIAIKVGKLKAFVEGRIFKTLKPVYPIIFGAIIGLLTFKLLNGDNIFIGLIKGMICGSFSDTIYHVVKRFIELKKNGDDQK